MAAAQPFRVVNDANLGIIYAEGRVTDRIVESYVLELMHLVWLADDQRCHPTQEA